MIWGDDKIQNMTMKDTDLEQRMTLPVKLKC